MMNGFMKRYFDALTGMGQLGALVLVVLFSGTLNAQNQQPGSDSPTTERTGPGTAESVREPDDQLSSSLFPPVDLGDLKVPPSAEEMLRDLLAAEGGPVDEAELDIPAEVAAAFRDPAEVLINPIKGVILFPDTREKLDDEMEDREFELKEGVQIIDIDTTFNNELTKMIEEKYLGKPFSLIDLDRLFADIILIYRQNDRPFTDVYAPVQEITSQVIRLAINEAEVGQIHTENPGKTWFSEKRVNKSLQIKNGDPIQRSIIEKKLKEVNKNPWQTIGKPAQHPFRKVTAEFAPGEMIGETDLNVLVEDSIPLRVFAGYDNGGTTFLGEDRFFVGATYYDFLQLDHQIGFQLFTGADYDVFHGAIVSYEAPAFWDEHVFAVTASAAETSGGVAAGGAGPLTSTDGVSWSVEPRYRFALPGEGEIVWPNKTGSGMYFDHDFSFGFDLKQVDSSLLFGGFVVFESAPKVFQLTAEYRATETDRFGYTDLVAQAVVSPGDNFDNNDDLTYSTARPLASSDYVYGKLNISRLTELPGGFDLSNSFTGQIANQNLLASEQLGAGGYDTIRGYEEREARGDRGFYLRNEIITPGFSILKNFEKFKEDDELRFLGFFDYGTVGNENLLPGENDWSDLAGAGVGFRYRVGRNFSLRFDYGVSLIDTGFSVDGEDSRIHLGTRLVY